MAMNTAKDGGELNRVKKRYLQKKEKKIFQLSEDSSGEVGVI